MHARQFHVLSDTSHLIVSNIAIILKCADFKIYNIINSNKIYVEDLKNTNTFDMTFSGFVLIHETKS